MTRRSTPREDGFSAPLRIVAPDWIDSWTELNARGNYADVGVVLMTEEHAGDTVFVEVQRRGPQYMAATIELTRDQIIPLFFALQGAIAAGQRQGMLPIESRRGIVERQLGHPSAGEDAS